MTTIKLPTGTFDYDPSKSLGRRGGFGQVFAGKSASGGEVAVKKLHLSAADVAHRELRIADELKGRSFEHVVPFIDAGEDADTDDYFVVMPRAEGSLQNRGETGGVLAAADAAVVLLQIVKGLIEVGELVHRDLKPDNVLFHEAKWKIADFGIARFVEEATASNTLRDCLSPFYAAPEQWRFERATHATDIYALGCIGFWLLTGKPPFSKNPEEEHQKAPLPAFPCSDSRLRALIHMMLRKLPETRPVLSRVYELLAAISAKPQPVRDGDALSVLATAGAQVAESEQKLQAQLQSEELAQKARLKLGSSAFEILSENIERLWGKIHGQAPSAQRTSRKGQGVFECQLGDGRLTVNLGKTNHVGAETFKHSGWDVIASAVASVTQNQRRYVWSSSLWYVRLKGAVEYRWHEVSYWTLAHAEYQPFACTDVADADYAASNIMHSVNIAFGPVPIDDEAEDDFHSRWIWLLAKASVGQLRHPSSLPIQAWPPAGLA